VLVGQQPRGKHAADPAPHYRNLHNATSQNPGCAVERRRPLNPFLNEIYHACHQHVFGYDAMKACDTATSRFLNCDKLKFDRESSPRVVRKETQMSKRESPLTLNEEVRIALLERHKDEHNAGHLYDRVAERLHHEGYEGLAQHFRNAAAEERGPHAQRVEDILRAFDIDPPHPPVQEPDLSAQESVLDLIYMAWNTEASLARRYEKSKALAAENDELGVEAMLDGILESQLHEVEEARALYRRCESAHSDGAGIMSVDISLHQPPAG
jgi:ferritin